MYKLVLMSEDKIEGKLISAYVISELDNTLTIYDDNKYSTIKLKKYKEVYIDKECIYDSCTGIHF